MSLQKTPWVMSSKKSLPEMNAERTHSYYLPMRTPEDDNKLLRPAQNESEQPCKNGAQCMAVQDVLGGPGIPLMAMSPCKECILCLRRSMRAQYIRYTILEETPPSNTLIQKWESKVGPGGYNKECCIGPDPSEKNYNGFITPFAVGLASNYTWVIEEEAWRIDQSPMLFCQAPRPGPHRGGASSVSLEGIPTFKPKQME